MSTPEGRVVMNSSERAKKRWILTDRQRFTGKYEVSTDGCWLWKGATTGGAMPYGTFWLQGKYYKAHRASYMLFISPIPEGKWVLHKCDNPLCVNPEHLFVGDRQDNVDDMLSKGRGGQWKNPPRGSRRRDSKLTVEKVLDIRSRCERGESQNSVAVLYGIRQTTVHKIVHRQRWAHV